MRKNYVLPSTKMEKIIAHQNFDEMLLFFQQIINSVFDFSNSVSK